MTIYISGPISGLPIEEAKKNFSNKAFELKEFGFTVVNPMELPHIHSGEWIDYMREDITALMQCDAIYLLPKWFNSKGAVIEAQLASRLGFLMWEEGKTEINESLKMKKL